MDMHTHINIYIPTYTHIDKHIYVGFPCLYICSCCNNTSSLKPVHLHKHKYTQMYSYSLKAQPQKYEPLNSWDFGRSSRWTSRDSDVGLDIILRYSRQLWLSSSLPSRQSSSPSHFHAARMQRRLWHWNSSFLQRCGSRPVLEASVGEQRREINRRPPTKDALRGNYCHRYNST